MTDKALIFIDYLRFMSDTLGGDVLPIMDDSHNMRSLISERAIDYELMRAVITSLQKHNCVFHLNDKVELYPCLDALGEIRGNLIYEGGDINQIGLLDRMGEITLSFFNITSAHPTAKKQTQSWPKPPAKKPQIHSVQHRFHR